MAIEISIRNCVTLFILCAVALALAPLGETAPKRQYKRVKPDTAKVDTSGAFFSDVFSQGLRGERPATLGSGGSATGPITTPNGGDPSPMPSGGGTGVWDEFVSGQTLEDEIKRTKLELDKDVTTPTAFNGLGHKKCRKHFSLLGMLFAIAHEHNGNVRWKDEAATARDLFGRAGRNCKAATPASYNESKLRAQDLADMVAGSRLQSNNEPAGDVDWSLICERSQLMKRIEKSNAKLKEFTANAAAFKSNSDEAKHEAEILSAISLAMQQAGMPDGDDGDYAAFCNTMKDAGKEIVEATKLGNVEAANKALGNVSRACDECHEIYRG
jgi:hypothetical protein